MSSSAPPDSPCPLDDPTCPASVGAIIDLDAKMVRNLLITPFQAEQIDAMKAGRMPHDGPLSYGRAR